MEIKFSKSKMADVSARIVKLLLVIIAILIMVMIAYGLRKMALIPLS